MQDPAQARLRWKTGQIFQRSGLPSQLGRLVSTRVADLFEGAFDELFPLLADVVIDGAHRLDGAGGRAGEGEFAIDHLALIECKSTVAEDHEAAVGELARVIFMEIKDDFFIGEIVFRDLHRCGCFVVFDSSERGVNPLHQRCAIPILS